MAISTNLFTEKYFTAYQYASRYTAEKILEVFNLHGLFLRAAVAHQRLEIIDKLKCTEAFIPSLDFALNFLVQELYVVQDVKDADYYSRTEKKLETWIDINIETNIKHSLKMIDFVADHWAYILSGKNSPIHLLFGAQGEQIWRDYFQHPSDLYYVHNQWLALYLNPIMEDGQSILELGAGYGSGTRCILNNLNNNKIHYTASDVSPMIVRHLSREFPHIESSVVNFDKDLFTQLNGEKYDYIVSINGLHCSFDIQAALVRIKKCLNPGGKVILSECIRDLNHSYLHQEFIFNLLPGYKIYQNGKFFINGFQTKLKWEKAFKETGYKNVEVILNEGDLTLGAIIVGEHHE
ncbi:class I SAM-dependent methyltransferase [Chengkuizengella sediminis]|uniref:class I SAM-dependent methyltransferase n=1 Tax=Chengkuizengella sediminis TaxID=1885917 RepID=UPI00138A2A50|nr:class I SAM-dependent methyltransferase [Chengkuizengella sediminis]NDI35955.1 class I SAM-dependent methyltransferase [Chengkuizengella sediminis]